MRSATLRWIILATAVAVALLVSAQLFWLSKIYNFEQREFSTSVIKSIQGVYEDLDITNSPTTPLRKLIEQPDANTFLFRIDSLPSKEVLLDDVLGNLEDFRVFTDCRIAVYEPVNKKYLYEVYVPSAATINPHNIGLNAPSYKKTYAYVRLYFPHRNHYILASMKWWIVSAISLFVVLLALSLSIFYLYRQKFLNEIQNDFIQNVTHEFQTPLTSLIVGLDALSKPFIADYAGKSEMYIKLMQTQTTYLKHHVENLMKVMKAESNGLVLEKSDTNPNELIKRAVTQLKTVIEEKGAVVNIDLDEANSKINADENSLYVAILNLLSNALKYAKAPVINVTTKVINNRYFISIKDNGVGIEEKYRRKLFKKFYRVPSGNVHNVKGLGLGLYFVKKVIDGHKGIITVKSSPDKGSEFIIELPIH